MVGKMFVRVTSLVTGAEQRKFGLVAVLYFANKRGIDVPSHLPL